MGCYFAKFRTAISGYSPETKEQINHCNRQSIWATVSIKMVYTDAGVDPEYVKRGAEIQKGGRVADTDAGVDPEYVKRGAEIQKGGRVADITPK